MRFGANVYRATAKKGFRGAAKKGAQGTAAVAFAMTMLALPARAGATVTEPNGAAVPGPSSTAGEVALSDLFASRNEAIDWKADAHASPDTFSPLCDFTATFVMKQSGSSMGVGWYNVDPAGAVPPLSKIYTIVAAGSPVGTVVTGASIRSDARYAGGLIGFALMRTPPSYSERRYNTICNGGSCAKTPGNWILSLAYKSTLEANAYYLAFEDGDTSSTGWSNDGDFNDYVFLFKGIACPGAGVPCTVAGAEGVCAQGLTECDATGVLACKRVTPASAEKCDGVDNDCNGTIDEGDLCTADNVCNRGVCVPRCNAGEFACRGQDVCVDGVCLDRACADVACPPDSVCVAGTCKSACDGVVCPQAQTCRAGRCADPCAGVTCASGRVCEGGVCVTDCSCQACSTSLTCNGASGHCVDPACASATCAAGTVCVKGSCQPVCQGVVCPTGQACESGQCNDVPVAVEPVGDAGTFDPGLPAGPLPANDPNDGGSPDASAGPASGSFDTNVAGCGCHVTGSTADESPILLGLLGAVAFVLRRPARRRK